MRYLLGSERPDETQLVAHIETVFDPASRLRYSDGTGRLYPHYIHLHMATRDGTAPLRLIQTSDPELTSLATYLTVASRFSSSERFGLPNLRLMALPTRIEQSLDHPMNTKSCLNVLVTSLLSHGLQKHHSSPN